MIISECMYKEVEDWIKKAEGDLKAAENSLNFKYYDWSCFQSEQAVEKALKALLLKEKNRIPKTHDLVSLGKEVNLPIKYIDYCKELTLSYIYIRYPDIENKKDIRDMAPILLNYAKEILQWIKEKI